MKLKIIVEKNMLATVQFTKKNIENFWSLLKRSILGIYHHVSPEHFSRYCDEFQFRYNSRKDKDTERFTAMLEYCEGRLMYRNLITK